VINTTSLNQPNKTIGVFKSRKKICQKENTQI
jgi:hypothetical protein